MALYKKFYLGPSSQRGFCFKIMAIGFYHRHFFFIIGTIIRFFSFILLRWQITSIDAQMLRQIGIPGTNPPNRDVVLWY